MHESETVNNWNEIIQNFPNYHILQTKEWGQLKSQFGWKPIQKTWKDNQGNLIGAAQILQRTISTGGFGAKMCILYIPRGPMLNWENLEHRSQILDDIQQIAKNKGAILLKIDPEIIVGEGIPSSENAIEHPTSHQIISELRERGWQFAKEQIQFRNTVWLDLSSPEDTLLSNMKQKTRYNIRLASRKGVTVRTGSESDLPTLYKMYAETSLRDGFAIRSEKYYLAAWQTFMKNNKALPLIAEYEGTAIAAIFLFYFGKKSWYLYGMSTEKHREKMPNYLLQWEAIKKSRELGCTQYDLWGAPDIFDKSDSMWGVFRFKEGLGGNVIRTTGAWDFTKRPAFYGLYTNILPRILDIMRRRGNKITRQKIKSED